MWKGCSTRARTRALSFSKACVRSLAQPSASALILLRRAATRQGGQEVTTAGIFVIDRDADTHSFHPLGALGSEIYAIHPLP
jgi:hypothetical protein